MRLTMVVLIALVLANGVPTSARQRVERVIEGVVLPNYGGDWLTVPTSINNRGEIAGWAVRGNDEWVAFVRNRRGDDEVIADYAYTADINDRGEVVGVRFPCGSDACPVEGFIWSRARGLQSLGSFLPFAVNDRGDMAGACDMPWRACVVRDDVVTDVAGPGSEAHGINESGDVVGTYGDNRAFHLTADWQFIDLGRAVAEDINDRRQIVGHRWKDMGPRGERGVVTAWTKRGPRSPAPEVSLGVAINSRGWVIANAFDPDEIAYSFAWNSSTGGRAMLVGSTGDEWVVVEDINDRGDVVGTAGEQATIWRVRQRHMKASSRD